MCTISPSTGNIEESISTLKFANRAKKIEAKVQVNEKQDADTLLQQYRDEINRLKLELQEAKDLAMASFEARYIFLFFCFLFFLFLFLFVQLEQLER